MASGYAHSLAMAHEQRLKDKIADTLRLYMQDEAAIKELTAALYGVIQANR